MLGRPPSLTNEGTPFFNNIFVFIAQPQHLMLIAKRAIVKRNGKFAQILARAAKNLSVLKKRYNYSKNKQTRVNVIIYIED